MQYLTYEEYTEIGGTLDLTAFKRNIDRACTMIDLRTQSRLEDFEEIPKIVKTVCADLVDTSFSLYLHGDRTVRFISDKAGQAQLIGSHHRLKTEADALYGTDKMIVSSDLLSTCHIFFLYFCFSA